jgi:hypothetical protein
MTRFQILKGEQPPPKKIDWNPDDSLFKKIKAEELKIRFVDIEKSWKPPIHWVNNLEGPFSDD